MKAIVFRGKNQIRLEDVPKPEPRAGEAVIRITATTICGTDVHIVRGEYPVKPGLVLGHEPVGVIDELGDGLEAPLSRRSARHRRRDHAVRPVLLLPERIALAVRRPARRVALRQHHQRRLGRVPAGAGRAGEPRADSRRARRRTGAAHPRHLLDRPQRRRVAAASASATRSRCSRRARSDCARRSARSCAARR